MCVLNRGNEKWKDSEETVESVPCISWKRNAFSQRNDSLTVEFQAMKSDVGQSFFFFFFLNCFMEVWRMSLVKPRTSNKAKAAEIEKREK